MLKGRRVGTFTAGLTLISFGVLFLLHSLVRTIDFNFIFTLWPVILILLGVEIIISYIVGNEKMLRYDIGAIVLIIILAFFAMGMGCIQFFLEHAELFDGRFHFVI